MKIVNVNASVNVTLKIILLSTVLAILSGCANRNIPLQEAFWQEKGQKIAIASIKAPKPKVHEVGGQGVLDMAITTIANNDLNQAVKKTDLAWYNEIPQSFAKRLKQSNINAMVYSKTLEKSKKSQASALAETNSDLLLTLELKAVGARREYAGGFIPQGGPEGYCVLVGELVNPVDKKVLWRHEAEITQKVVGKWDEPPHFPNFNNALSLAIAEAKEEVLESFFSGR